MCTAVANSANIKGKFTVVKSLQDAKDLGRCNLGGTWLSAVLKITRRQRFGTWQKRQRLLQSASLKNQDVVLMTTEWFFFQENLKLVFPKHLMHLTRQAHAPHFRLIFRLCFLDSKGLVCGRQDGTPIDVVLMILSTLPFIIVFCWSLFVIFSCFNVLFFEPCEVWGRPGKNMTFCWHFRVSSCTHCDDMLWWWKCYLKENYLFFVNFFEGWGECRRPGGPTEPSNLRNQSICKLELSI